MAAPTNPFLPQYQDEATQAQQMAALAQMLAANRAPTEGKMISGHYIRPSPWAHVNNLVAGLAGMYGQNKSRQQLAQILQRQAMAQQAERQGVMGMLAPQDIQDPTLPRVDDEGAPAASGLPAMRPGDPMGAERRALGSQFPDIQKLGEELAKQRLAVFKEAAASADPTSLAESWGDLNKVRGVQINPVTVTETPAGPIYSQSTSKGALQTGGFPRPVTPPAASVTGDILQKKLDKFEVERTKRAVPALENLAATQQAYALLKSGALQVGSEQDKLDYIQKLARFIPGLKVPSNVPANEAFNNYVLPALGETLEKMKGGTGSQSEQELLEGLKRGITTTREPEALAAMLERAMQISVQTIADYNTRVQQAAAVAASNKDLKLDPKLFLDLEAKSNIPMADTGDDTTAIRADPGILTPALRGLIPADKGGTKPPPKRLKYKSRG